MQLLPNTMIVGWRKNVVDNYRRLYASKYHETLPLADNVAWLIIEGTPTMVTAEQQDEETLFRLWFKATNAGNPTR